MCTPQASPPPEVLEDSLACNPLHLHLLFAGDDFLCASLADTPQMTARERQFAATCDDKKCHPPDSRLSTTLSNYDSVWSTFHADLRPVKSSTKSFCERPLHPGHPCKSPKDKRRIVR